MLSGHFVPLTIALTLLAGSKVQSADLSQSRLALTRTFCVADANALPASFDSWNTFPPCDPDTDTKPPVDLFLVFSRTLNSSSEAIQAVDKVRNVFETTDGWGNCINRLVAIGVDIPQEQDIYDQKLQSESAMWTNGPNRQFERTVREIQSGKYGNYENMFLMEGDTIPVKPFWLDILRAEIETKRPFAIMGSKYSGDKWDPFFDILCSSLVNHINGNAVYNITHPLFNLIVSELEDEATTPLNSIAYDYRISQIIEEGWKGIVPDIPIEVRRDPKSGNIIPLPSNTEKFASWVEPYLVSDDVPYKESKVIANYATTNMLRNNLTTWTFARLKSIPLGSC